MLRNPKKTTGDQERVISTSSCHDLKFSDDY